MMKAAFFDVDGTLTETRVWNGLMDYFRVHRVRPEINIGFQVFHYFLYILYLINGLMASGGQRPWQSCKNIPQQAIKFSWYRAVQKVCSKGSPERLGLITLSEHDISYKTDSTLAKHPSMPARERKKQLSQNA
jgi:hypothetical protein